MERLQDLILERRSEIVARWTESIRLLLAPEGTPRFELIDHLPSFLDELARNLAASSQGTEPSGIAAKHGEQRLRLGFDLSALVREYGMLRRCLVTLTRETGIEVSPRDWDILFESLISGIADAVTQFTQEREADRKRQSNEHFAFLAHELRNPLWIAQLSMDNLQTKGLLPENRSSQILKRSLQRIHQLVEGSLELAVAEADVAVQLSSASVDELLAEANTEANALAAEKGIEIELPAKSNLTLRVDRKLIRSALGNLLQNAVKFTPAGGRIAVRVKPSDHRVGIEVQDSCGGIPVADPSVLFAPFKQAGNDRTGFGLGLSIAKNAATAHGGSIEVTNQPGVGCIFTLELPLPKNGASQ
jgi:signal transduction histidine kinase